MQGVKVTVQTDGCSYSVLLKTHREGKDTAAIQSSPLKLALFSPWLGASIGSAESGSQKVAEPPRPLVSSTDTKPVLYLIFQTNKIQNRWSLTHTDNSKTETN